MANGLVVALGIALALPLALALGTALDLVAALLVTRALFAPVPMVVLVFLLVLVLEFLLYGLCCAHLAFPLACLVALDPVFACCCLEDGRPWLRRAFMTQRPSCWRRRGSRQIVGGVR